MDNNETVENKDTININRICRFCADINTKLYPIFENKYEEKLKSFINIEVSIIVKSRVMFTNTSQIFFFPDF